MHCQLSEHILQLTKPMVTAIGSINRRLVWVVAITDETGRVGLGEAAPMPVFGGEDPLTCSEKLAKATALLTGDFILSWLTRARPDAALGRCERLLADAPCARNAVEGALLDLLAQREGKPLSEILAGGPATKVVPVNALLSGESTLNLMQRIGEQVAMGYTTFKLKVGGDRKSDLDRVFAVRELVGSQARLRIDSNGAWTSEAAQSFLASARDANLEFCEQPLPADDLAGLAALRKQTGVAIAVDESIRQPADVGRVAAAQAADIIVLKPMFLGGWRPTKQAADLARSQGLEVIVTTSFDGSIGRGHATHIAAAIGLTTRAQGLGTGELLAEDLTDRPLRPHGGAITLDGQPGLGIGRLL